MEVKESTTHQLIAILGLLAIQSSSVRKGKGLKEYLKKKKMPVFWKVRRGIV